MVATVETWDLDPEFPVQLLVERLDQVSGYDRGIVQRAGIQTSVSVNTVEAETQVWAIKYTLASWADFDRYVAIWRNTNRGALALSFTPPDGTALPVTLSGEPTARLTGPTTLAFDVELVEAINS